MQIERSFMAPRDRPVGYRQTPLHDGPDRAAQTKYHWTAEKRVFLEALLEINPNMGREEILWRMNAAYHEGVLLRAEPLRNEITVIYSRRPDLRRRSSHIWTDAEVADLIKFVGEDSTLSSRALALKLNELHKPEIVIDELCVRNKLSDLKRTDVALKDVKRSVSPTSSKYQWTDAKLEALKRWVKEDPQISNRDMAKRLNLEFPDSIPATYLIVDSQMVKISSISPEFKRRSLHIWTDAELAYLTNMITEDPSLSTEELARRLNAKYPSTVPFNPKMVENKLANTIYKQHPELKRRETNDWTEEMEERLLSLIASEPDLTTAQITVRFNSQFKTDLTERAIEYKFQRLTSK